MAVRYYIDGVELVGQIEVHALEQGLACSADGGSIGTSGIRIDDPAGVLDIVGWRRFHVEEDTATPPRIWTGFIGARQITDGDLLEAPGVGRVWDCTLLDLNAILGLRCFRNAVSKRGAESDVDRIDWALSAPTGGLAGVVFDNGGVERDFVRQHDESDLRGKFPEEMLSEMAMDIRMFYLYWDETAATDEEISLFYGFPGSPRGLLDAMISNLTTDGTPDDNVFAPIDGWQQTREPGFTYSGIYLTTKAGTIYRTNSITAATFITRDDVVQNDRIGRATTAEWWADVLLDRGSTEKDALTMSIEVDEDQVNVVREGFAIPVRVTNLPGYDTPHNVLVQRRVIKRAPGTVDRYQIDLTLSNKAPGRGAGGGGDPGTFPHPQGQPGALVQHATGPASVVLPHTPADGDLLLCWMTERGYGTYPPVPSGWTSIATAKKQTSPGLNVYHGRLVYKIASGDSSTVVVFGTGQIMGTVTEWAGVTLGANVAQSDIASVNFTAGGAITPAAANAIVVGHGVIGAFFGVAVTPSAGVIELADDMFLGGNVPDNWVGYKTVATPASTIVGGTLTGNPQDYEFGGVTVTLLPDASPEPPLPGQWVGINPPEYVVMTGTNGTTAFPFADNSLRVFYDNQEQTAAILSYDGAAGTFVMAAAPIVGMQVTVQYQGR